MLIGPVRTLLITLRWKIAFHTGTLAGTGVIAALAFGLFLLLLSPLVAEVCWARAQLGDHTPAQALGGVILGTLVAGSVFTPLR
jgi:membrane-associated phospholipid phosphatase